MNQHQGMVKKYLNVFLVVLVLVVLHVLLDGDIPTPISVIFFKFLYDEDGDENDTNDDINVDDKDDNAPKLPSTSSMLTMMARFT